MAENDQVTKITTIILAIIYSLLLIFSIFRLA